MKLAFTGPPERNQLLCSVQIHNNNNTGPPNRDPAQPPTACLLVGHRKLERRGAIAQGEYVSKLNGSRYSGDVVSGKLIGRAPLEPVRGVIDRALLPRLRREPLYDVNQRGREGTRRLDE